MISGPNTPRKMRNRKQYKLEELMDFEVDKSNIVGSKGSYIEESTQMQEGMRIFSTSWKDTEGKRWESPQMPQGFNQLAYLPQNSDKAIAKLQLDEFLAQPIVKAQNRRAHELITTMTRIGEETATACLTTLKGEEVQVTITPDLIAEITKLTRGEPVTRHKDCRTKNLAKP